MSSVEPTLWVRNETKKTITYNTTYLNWELPPYPDPKYIQVLPWEVATSSGFSRIWEATPPKITVALDPNFTYIVTELPSTTQTTYRPFVFNQPTPQATTIITHNLARTGPVDAVVTSLDGSETYEFVNLDVIDINTCRISFENPIPFQATIF
jgi:hypothetical protein